MTTRDFREAIERQLFGLDKNGKQRGYQQMTDEDISLFYEEHLARQNGETGEVISLSSDDIQLDGDPSEYGDSN